MSTTSDKARQELNALENELRKSTFDDASTSKSLESLKVIARVPHNAPCVYSKDGIRVLAEGAFGSNKASRPASSLEAARILANALLLQDRMQQVLADLGHINNILDFYKSPSLDHEFVGGRILFLLTYKSKVDFVNLIEAHGMVNHIGTHLKRHKSSILDDTSTSNPMNTMALVESLKLLYNIASKNPAQMHFFSTVLDTLINIFNHVTLALTPLDPPVTQLLNAMAVIDWPLSLAQAEGESILRFSRRLVEILDRSTSSMRPAQLETALVPLITVLRKIHELSNPTATELLRLSLLPQEEERDKPLGHSQTLASRLLRLQTSGGLTVLPQAVSSLLFDLSDRDAAKFVHNIGYGHAAGFLMTHNIPIPEELRTSSNDTMPMRQANQINPITGQRLDAEAPVSLPEMTDEEKEREAERLFVLFERLKATGVMSVENPLRTAQESGRFEELSDGEPD